MAKLRQLSCRMCEAVMFHKGNYIVLFRVQSARLMKKLNMHGAVTQLARVPALQAGCRGFEPLRLHQGV